MRHSSLRANFTTIYDFLWRWLPALLWMGLIFFLSSQSTLPKVEDSFADLLLKKGTHMAAYAFLALLYCRGMKATSASQLGLCWALTVLYALSDEYHQTFVPGRHGTIIDVGIDSLGAALGLTAWWLLCGRHHSRTSSSRT